MDGPVDADPSPGRTPRAVVAAGRPALRAVVAEGQPLLRRGLVEVLQDGGVQVVAQAIDTAGALRAVAERNPDVLVVSLDLKASFERGHVVAIARDRWPALGIVALGDTPGDTAMRMALELGASAYVAKSAEPAHLVSATVQSAAAPGAFLAENLAALRQVIRAGSGPRLTAREADVLRLAAEGLTVRAISARLFVSEATTRSHLSGIYRKLGVTSRSQAVLAAERLGMLR